MVRSLQELGHEVPFQDESCKVQIHFSQPEWYDFYDNQYKIGYTPWESSELPEHWLDGFNECDEVWTPSPLIAEWYKDAGVTKPIFIYEHGVDSEVWTPRHRTAKTKLKFLHHGEPAPRKGGEMAVKAFRAAFGDRDDVHLTIKGHNRSTIRVKDRMGSIVGQPHELYDNVTLLTGEYDEADLVNLYLRNDVLVYPGYGEGFGLIPLQAMATGMPVICTEAWAPYKRFLLPELRLSSKLGDSPWPGMHPGKMFFPEYDHLVEIYRDVAENFDAYADKAHRIQPRVVKAYDWLDLTEQAFEHVTEAFSA